MRDVLKGSTDQSVVIRIVDAEDGTPEQAVEHDTSGIALWYRREGGSVTSITPAALAAANSAHSDGGIEHLDDGYYRLDPPDAAFASGANGVLFGGTVTGMVVIGAYVHLTAVNVQDAVRAGMTALPNAAADAAGGLPISDAGGLDIDAKLANTNEVTAARMGALTDWVNGGRLDLLLDSVISLLDDARTEPGQGALPVNPDAMTKIDYIYKFLRNKKDNDGTETKIYADNGTTVDHKQSTVEAGGTVTIGEVATGA